MPLTIQLRFPDRELVGIEIGYGEGIDRLYDKAAKKVGFAKDGFTLMQGGVEVQEVEGFLQDEELEVRLKENAMERSRLLAEGRILTKDVLGMYIAANEVSMVRRYLIAGVTPTPYSSIGHCMSSNKQQMLETLLEHGVRPSTMNLYGILSLEDDAFTLVVTHMDADLLNGLLLVALSFMCLRAPRLEYILKRGANPNYASDPERNTPLHILADVSLSSCISVKRFSLLMKYGADVTLVNAAMLTPLDIIIKKGLKDTTLGREFIRHGGASTVVVPQRVRGAGLVFPVSRVRKNMKRVVRRRVSSPAGILLTGVLEHVTSQLISLASTVAHSSKKPHLLTPRHINLAIRSDGDFSALLSNVSIATGGVPPHVHKAVSRKARPRKAARKRVNIGVPRGVPDILQVPFKDIFIVFLFITHQVTTRMKMEPLKPSKLANKPSGKYAHVKSKVGSVRKAGEASKPTPKPPAKRSAPKEPITPARGRPAARTLSAPRTASKKKMCSSSPAKKVPLRTATPQKKKAKTKEKKVTIVSPSEDAKQHVEEVKTVEPTPVSTSASAPSPVAPAHKKVTVEYQGRSRYPNPLSGGFRPGALIPASRESTDDDLCVSEDTAQSTPVKHSPFAISPFTESPFCKIKTPEALKLSQKLFASSPEMFKGKTVPAPDVPMQDHTEVPETQPAAASDTSAPVTNDEPATVEPVHEPLVTGPVATEEPAETPVEATVADELVKEPTEVAAELAEAVVADEPMTMETAVVADSATEGPDTEMPVVPTAEEPAVVVAATEDPLTETPIEHAADELMIESAEKPTVDTPVEVKVENLAEETEIAEPEVPVTKEPAETEVPVTEECAEEPAETEMTATEEIPKGVEPEVQVPQLPAEPEVSATVEHPKDVEPEVPAAEECAEEFAETEMTATKECPKDVEPEMPVAEELAEDVEPKVPVTGEPAVVVEVATTEELVVEVAASVQVVEMTAALIVETAVESVDKRLSGSKRKLETSEDEGPEGETTAKKSRSRSRSASIEGTVAAGAVEELPEVNAVFPDFEASECSSETSSERRAREERSTRELVESVQQQGHGTITEVGVKRAAEVDPEHAAKKQKVEKTSTKKETEIKQPVVAEEPKKPEENKDEAMPEAADKAMPEAKEEKADDKKKEDEDEEEEEEEEEEEDDKLTEAAIKAMKYRELQAECKKRGLKASGKRDKLVETLIANQK